MLAISKTVENVRTDRERVAQRSRVGSLNESDRHVLTAGLDSLPAEFPVRAEISADIAAAFGIVAVPGLIDIVPVDQDPIQAELNDAVERATKHAAEQREKDHKKFSIFDWISNPSTWSVPACVYYLETLCKVYLPRGSADPDNEHNLRATVVSEYRLRNTETATVEISRAGLLNAVKTAKKLNPRNPAKTVSLSVNGSVDVVTSDSDCRYSQSLSYVSKSGDLRLRFSESRLNAIASKLKADFLDLTLSSVPGLNEHILTIKSDSAEFTIPVERPDISESYCNDFPATFAHNVDGKELLTALRMTEFATDTESSRYALGGLYFAPGLATLDIAATDSRRLALEIVQAEVLGELPERGRGETFHEFGCVVPSGIAGILCDELKRNPSQSVVSFAVATVVISRIELTQPLGYKPTKGKAWSPDKLGKVETEILGLTITNFAAPDGRYWQEHTRTEFVFELSGAFSIRGVPVEGRFPRYRDVIPTSFGSSFDFDRKAFLNACETITLSTDEESRGVDFAFPCDNNAPPVLTLRTNSSTLGKAHATIRCNAVNSDKRHTVTLDPKYTIDFLKSHTSEIVTLRLNDADSTVVLSDKDGSGVYVQMPLRQDR